MAYGCWIFIQLSLYFLLFKNVSSQCDGTGPLLLTAGTSPQYFTSPNYPSNYPANSDCSWRIEAPSVYEKVIINIEDFDSESTTSDYMDLYDGYNSSATLVIRMAVTNRKTLNAFVSSSDVLYITFVSDYLTEYSGFQILYFVNNTANQPACDEILDVSSQEQVLMSPNLPDPYDAIHSCSWTFSSTTGILFQIKFLDMGSCGQSHLRFYDGNSTDDNQLDTVCSDALTYEFSDVETTGFVGHIAWTVTSQSSDYYGFMLIYRTNVVTTTSTTTTTTTIPTTTLTPGVFDNCTASGAYLSATISPNFVYISSPDYTSGEYPRNTLCRWYITAPQNYSVEAYFDDESFAIEYNIYCSYDYVIFYDGNTTSGTMLNKFCGFERSTFSYRSSGDQMLIIFSSDYALQYSGFRIKVKAVDSTYPGCKADYTEYSVTYNKEAVYISNNYNYLNTTSTPNYGISDYQNNLEMFWLFTNSDTINYKMVLEIISISIERAYGCIFDRLVLYNGPCISDGIQDTVCGYWAKRWDLEGPEFLLHFHSDGYKTQSGFELRYYSEDKAVTPPSSTTTTTGGPPVEAVVEAVKSLLTNYSSENLPTKDLSTAITTSIDFYLVGINGLDEVEQKLTTTGQFEVTWKDSALTWDPLKRQRVVQVLLPQDDLWKPDIALMNGFTTITAMGAKFMFIDVNYNGSCIWKPYQIMESVCKVDMTHYPYDRQTCVLKFGTWSSDDSEVVTELGSLGLQIHPNFQENSEWNLIKTETRQEDNNNHKVVEFFLTLERNSRYVTFYMTMPIVVLAYMNIFTFVIPVESGEKTGFSITIFLSFVVLLIINNGSMPENSDTISIYAAYVLAMTILSAVALIVCVLQIRAVTFSESTYPIAKRVKKAMRHIKLVQSILTCRGKKNKVGNDDNGVYEFRLKNKLANENHFVGKQSISENEEIGYETLATKKGKKVTFKGDDAVVGDSNYTDRFVIPRKRETDETIKYDRENTLFDAGTFVRSATMISINDNLSINRKLKGNDSISMKTVKFADEHVGYDKHTKSRKSNASTNPTDYEPLYSETKYSCETGKGQTPEEKWKEIATLIDSRSTSYVGKAVASPIQTLDRSTSFDENLSTQKHDKHFLSTEDITQPKETDNESDINGGILPARTIVISQKPESNGQSFPYGEKYSEPLVSSPEDIETAGSQIDSSKHQHLQVTGISNYESGIHESCLGDQIPNQLSDNIRPASVSTKKDSNQDENDKQKQITSDDIVPTSVSTGVASKMTVGNAGRLDTLTDDITENQQTSAFDFKMNRPSSNVENRPLSVNKQCLSTGSRLILVESGRAVSAGNNRPRSQGSCRPVSILSNRSLPLVRQRPPASLTRSDTADTTFEAEETDRKLVHTEAELESETSGESLSEGSTNSSTNDSENNDQNKLSWPDLVSCTDVLFFLIYLLLTTLMTLAMFLTMITAY
ncbi:uncharacterized protein LOC123556921 [Mercenaria mercenaria]|uniref:uncharacterized protein LOC123556921 n=1 Tax=Mercenaria mercenaria TaxID=6596 RepID=UPI00234E68BA|nr:uncharacterized protein LOC123556921 [Mercenaria mercenaria]